MLIIGAQGFAKEVLEILHQNNDIGNLAFYDDVHKDSSDFLFQKFKILRSPEEAQNYFKNVDARFTLGLGNPKYRKLLHEKFLNLGGELISIFSKKADIGFYGNNIKHGCIITSGVIITSSVSIGIGVLVNLNATIGHDCIIHNYVEICPSVNISGRCVIGENVFIGTGAVILPGIIVGKNSIIGAGSIVTKNVPESVIVAGIPAKTIKQL